MENRRHISETLSERKAFIPEAHVATLALVTEMEESFG